jgi:hypothetical protein
MKKMPSTIERAGLGSTHHVLGVVGRHHGDAADGELLDQEHGEQDPRVGVREDVAHGREGARGAAPLILGPLA